MQHAVGRDQTAAVDASFTAQARCLAAGFLDDQQQRRDVPWFDFRVDRDLARPLRHEHVLIEVAEAARAVDAAEQAAQRLRWRRLAPPETAVERQRVVEITHRRHVQPPVAFERAGATRRMPPGPQRRGAHQARHDVALFLEREQRPEHGDATDEVARAVDRIDDEPRRAIAAGRGALLFAEHTKTGMSLPDDRAGRFFDRVIGLGHGRQVGFFFDAQVGAAKMPQGDLVGRVRDLGEQRQPLNWGHGPNLDRLWAMRTWPALTLALLCGCSSELTPPGPGVPQEVRLIRLFDGAGAERTGHVFLFPNDNLRLEVRMYAGAGYQITAVPGGSEVAFRFDPPTIATSAAIPSEPMRRAVTTTGARNTEGNLYVTVLFLADSSSKEFGPFNCLVH